MRYCYLIICLFGIGFFSQTISSQNKYYSNSDVSILKVADSEWKKVLPNSVYQIMRLQATERPFSGIYNDNKKKGVYYCAACGNALFGSNSKFDSGTGWPSFYQTYTKNSVKIKIDKSLNTVREEVVCKRCDGHLGHVFNDGPKPTYKRYCINSLSLDFKPN